MSDSLFRFYGPYQTFQVSLERGSTNSLSFLLPYSVVAGLVGVAFVWFHKQYVHARRKLRNYTRLLEKQLAITSSFPHTPHTFLFTITSSFPHTLLFTITSSFPHTLLFTITSSFPHTHSKFIFTITSSLLQCIYLPGDSDDPLHVPHLSAWCRKVHGWRANATRGHQPPVLQRHLVDSPSASRGISRPSGRFRGVPDSATVGPAQHLCHPASI